MSVVLQVDCHFVLWRCVTHHNVVLTVQTDPRAVLAVEDKVVLSTRVAVHRQFSHDDCSLRFWHGE